MKKIFLLCLLITGSLFFTPQNSNAQVIVKIRPEAPRIIAPRPAMRGRGMIWIEPEWYWNPRVKEYRWRDGRWVKPRRHANWVPGHWAEEHEGYNWVPGYWGRRK